MNIRERDAQTLSLAQCTMRHIDFNQQMLVLPGLLLLLGFFCLYFFLSLV